MGTVPSCKNHQFVNNLPRLFTKKTVAIRSLSWVDATLPRSRAISFKDPVSRVAEGEELLNVTQCLRQERYWCCGNPNDEDPSVRTRLWAKITDNDKPLLDATKDTALMKCINRKAWKPVKREVSVQKKRYLLDEASIPSTKIRPQSCSTKNRRPCLE